MRPFLMTIVLALVCALSAPAFAAPVGTKTTGKITIHNNSNFTIAAVVNPSASLQAATTPQQFTDRGGKILNPGERVTIKVDAGPVLIGAALVQGSNIPMAGNFTQSNTTVAKGKTRTATVTGTSTAVIAVK